MQPTFVRILAAALLLVGLAACSGAPIPSSGAPSTDVNPVTGARGGSSSR